MSRSHPTSTDRYQYCLLAYFTAYWGDVPAWPRYDCWEEVRFFNTRYDERYPTSTLVWADE